MMRSFHTILLTLSLLVVLGCVPRAVSVAPETNPRKGSDSVWTPKTQMRVKRITNPRLSKAGDRVVFEVAHADLDADRWVKQLHLASADGSRSSRPLEDCAGCSDARWDAKGSSLIVRATDDENRERLQSFDIETGSLTPITPEDVRVGWYEPSPNGEWLAYTVFASEPSGHWTLRAISLADGSIREWTTTESVAGFSWSPTNDRLVAAFQPSSNFDWRGKSLKLLDLADPEPIPLETGSGAAWQPVFGPQGRRVAFAASRGPATWMRNAELRILDLESGALTTLAPTPDANVDLLAWRPGESLIGMEYEGSTRRLIALPLDGSSPRYIGPADRSIRNPHVRGDRVTFTSQRWNEAPEVFVAPWPMETFEQVSSVHPETFAPLGRTTMIRWTSSDGADVEGLLTYPVDYQPGSRVPLLVRLHGGPPFPAADRFLGSTYFTAYPLASMASEGFAILQPNFRGSTGYGRAFRHGLHRDWGGQDYRDLLSGVDALIDRGIADPNRLGVMGWSFGGYLSAWTITQSDRFASASMGAAMTDLNRFDETTSLGGMLGDWLGGSDDDRSELSRQRSPLTHAAAVRSSVLIQHGTKDTRVPIEQAQLFAEALENSGAKFELRTYEGGHGPRTPRAELAVLQQNLEWFITTLRDRTGKERR